MNRGRVRTSFTCRECGAQAPKWEGRCRHCGQWNTLTRVQGVFRQNRGNWLEENDSVIQELSSVSGDTTPRLRTSLQELNRVLGGGIVPGSLVLIAGDPGIGKSTLLLQTCASLVGQGQRLLYVSGEESAQQVSMRAQRLGISGEALFFLGEMEVEKIVAHMDGLRPSMVVVDSAQTLFSQEIPSGVGSVAQVREGTRRLMQWSKVSGIPVLLAGHVTKDGSVAGPKALEHMVDVVLYLEGDTLGPYRMLRGVKNRFGSTNEIGMFQMGNQGMEEVLEPSLILLSNRHSDSSGSVIIVTLEGTRPLLAEVQSLTTPTVFAQPRRTATGVDFHRLLLVSAVTTKRLGIPLGEQDIIVNVTGGLRVHEPAADLGIALALISSFYNVPCDPSTVAIGELGLGGELRGVPQLDRRLDEAAKMGFQRAVIPVTANQELQRSGLELIAVPTLGRAVREILPRARSRGGGSPKTRRSGRGNDARDIELALEETSALP